MARIETEVFGFSSGVIDKDKLSRADVDHIRLAASRQTNMLPNSVGRATPRTGLERLSAGLTEGRPIAFVSGSDQSYVLELGINASSAQVMRVWDGTPDTEPGGVIPRDGHHVTRNAVTATITNGDFSSGTGWTLSAASGQSSTVSGGLLRLAARAHGGRASARQTITINETNVEHAFHIQVSLGPVWFRAGSSAGEQDYIEETELRTGHHSLAFTPTGNVSVEFSSKLPVEKQVNIIQFESAGVMEVLIPWTADQYPNLQTEQSLDVMWATVDGVKPYRIERHGNTSWSVCEYNSDDGPFTAGRTAEVRIKPSLTEGNGTLTASAPFFKPEHVGALFKITHKGQKIVTWVADEDQFSDAFLVSGITETNFEERKHTCTISGTWVGTLRYERSFTGEFGEYKPFRREQASATVDIVANATFTNDDNDDNVDEWIRIGFENGRYTSGEAALSISYPGGFGYGICRVTDYQTSTVVAMEVLRPFKGTYYSDDWQEGRYSQLRGYPSAVALSDGRLAFAASDKFDASVSDAYESFDETFEGDAGPISRALAVGGRNKPVWMNGNLDQLMIGCDTRILAARASSLGEVITPDNFGVKGSAKVGASPVAMCEFSDDRGLFVHNSGTSIFELAVDPTTGNYRAAPYSLLSNDLFEFGISRLALQTFPDQRIWVVGLNRALDVSLTCIVDIPNTDTVAAHIPFSTPHGTVTDICVLPGDVQDRVYCYVQRDTGYSFERFAKEKNQTGSGGTYSRMSRCLDSHVKKSIWDFGTVISSAVVTGLDHLEGLTVCAWVDGAPLLDATITDPSLDNVKTFVVTGGQITLPSIPATDYCIGLAYDLQWMSAKLGYGIQGYNPASKNKSLASLGLGLADYVRSGVKYGTAQNDEDFSATWNLPEISTATGDVGTEVVEGLGADEYAIPVVDQIGVDTRLCIGGSSSKPFSLIRLMLGIETVG